MKKLSIALFSVLLTSVQFLFAQTPDTVWTHIVDKTGNQAIYDIYPVSDGFIAGGYTTDGSHDMLMMKFDDDGEIVWEKTFGDPDTSEDLNCMIKTADGGYMLAGSKEGETSTDAWFVKTDASGNQEWSSTAGNDDISDGVNSVAQTTDGGFMACGTIWGSGTTGYDIVVYKISASGGFVFREVFSFGGTSAEHANSIVAHPDGGAVIGGETQANNPSYDYDIYLLKVDALGNEEWMTQIGDDWPLYEGCNRLMNTSDGGYLIAGYQNDDGLDNQWYIVKTTDEGVAEWTHTIGGTYHEKAFGCCETEAGDFIVSGNYHDELWNAFLVKYNPAGDTLWTKMIKHDIKNFYLYSVQAVEGGDIIAAGSASDVSSDFDAYICRLSETSTGVQWQETDVAGNAVSVYQKLNGELVFSYYSEFEEDFSLHISGINGQLVFPSKIWSIKKGANHLPLHLSLMPGIYVVNLENDKIRLSEKFVVSQ